MSYEKNDNFAYFNIFILCMWLQFINKVKVTHQSEGHIKIKVKYLRPFQLYVGHTVKQVGGLHFIEMRFFLFCWFFRKTYFSAKEFMSQNILTDVLANLKEIWLRKTS